MAVGGDIIEVTYNHPTLGTGVFYPKSAEDTTYNLGGFRSNDDNQAVTGSGEMLDQINNSRWSFEVPCAWDMNNRDDLEKASALAASPVLADWTITHINGVVHGGSGKPVGDLEGNSNAATFTLKVAGSGQLKKIVG